MATETIQLATAHPVRIFPNGEQVAVTLVGTRALYAQTEQLTSASYDGALTNGQALTVTAPTSFLASVSPCALSVARSSPNTAVASLSHGTNTAATRPATTGTVIWAGSVTPSNARAGDLWVRTA